MFRDQARYLTVVLLLLLAGGGSLFLPRFIGTSPISVAESESEEVGITPIEKASHVSFIDVSGWYQVTPYERAVAGPVDFSSWEELAPKLPHKIGPWYAPGEDIPPDQEMMKWFKNPDIAIMRLFTNEEGDWIYLSILGNRGSKSFSLFEHTPLTCYPANGWRTIDQGLEPIEIGDSEVYVQRFIGQTGERRLLILYWYLWTNPGRDPKDGVLAIRIHSAIEGSVAQTLEMEKDFFRLLFPMVLPWHRFG
ncbi:MAG: exosortase-associated EpsI family protein [Anaerolineae bacterium]